MIDSLIDMELIEKVKENPGDMHWSQSPLEKVTDAKVLLDGRYFVLTRTDFLAPKLVQHSTWRTESIGETYRRGFEESDNLASFQDITRWFYQLMLPENYQSGDFPHADYTLRLCNPKNKAFVNLRIFPEGSYLVDLIDVEVTLPNIDGNAFRGGGNCSYHGDEEDNDSLKPEERTKTLDQLAKVNRMRQGDIVIQTPEGEYEGKFGENSFVNYDDFSTLHSFDIDERVIGKIHSADLSERYVQRALVIFKRLLEECGIPYRK